MHCNASAIYLPRRRMARRRQAVRRRDLFIGGAVSALLMLAGLLTVANMVIRTAIASGRLA